MPVEDCTKDGDPGYRAGPEGFCYTYPAGNEEARKEAKKKAHLQLAAIERETRERHS